MTHDARLNRVKQADHWRVLIRPTSFVRDRIESLRECRELIEKSQVQLRGWYYPHIDKVGITNGQNWVESSADFMHHLEYWRLYQSGQWLHLFAYGEDLEPSTRERLAGDHKGLEVVTLVYRVTEILTFVSRLAVKNVFDSGAEIQISLLGTQGRELFFYDFGRILSLTYRCHLDAVTFNRVVSTPELIGKSDEIALDAAVHIFERFNWNDVPRGVLAEDQRRLLERRF